ncbi:MAG TPA: hypothetical protein PLH57_11825, partial [Oligoflexia bacterium]|nr:hypothetical protein [Oligoflexia bacterium]
VVEEEVRVPLENDDKIDLDPNDARDSSSRVMIGQSIAALDSIPMPRIAREYSIKSELDQELCIEHVFNPEWKRQRTARSQGYDPERKEREVQKERTELLEQLCGFREENYRAEDNVPTFGDLLRSREPKVVYTRNSAIDGYGAGIGATVLQSSGGAAGFRGSVHIDANPKGANRVLLDTETGITMQTEFVIDPTNDQTKIPYARLTVKGTNGLDKVGSGDSFAADGARSRLAAKAPTERVHEYTIERNADLDRFDAHVKWGRRGRKNLTNGSYESGTLGWYLPWVWTAKAGVGTIDGQLNGHIGAEAGLEERYCKTLKKNHRACVSSALLGTLGYLEAGLELRLGGEYEYTIESERGDTDKLLNETVFSAGIENTYNYVYDAHGEHDSNRAFVGVAVEYRTE